MQIWGIAAKFNFKTFPLLEKITNCAWYVSGCTLHGEVNCFNVEEKIGNETIYIIYYIYLNIG